MPLSGSTLRNHSLLTAALEGLELQKQRIDEQIREVRALLGKSPARRGRPPGSARSSGSVRPGASAGPGGSGAGTKRAAARLSPAARKKIAAAQKRRWAEYRKANGSKSE
jgi:hypothetical protein